MAYTADPSPDSTGSPPNQIVLSVPPKGVFLEGNLDGASGVFLPGISVTPTADPPDGGGRLNWEPNTSTSGLVAILREDALQGHDVDTAYSNPNGTADSPRGFIYVPALGETVLILATAAGTGTGDSVSPGDRFQEAAGGVWVSNAAGRMLAIEEVDDLTAEGVLIKAMRIG